MILRYLSVFLLILGLTMHHRLSAQVTAENIVHLTGSWVLDDVSMEPDRPDILEEFQKQVKGNKFLILNEDGTGMSVEVHKQNVYRQAINWSFDSESGILKLHDAEGRSSTPEEYRVVDLNEASLVFQIENEDISLRLHLAPIDLEEVPHMH